MAAPLLFLDVNIVRLKRRHILSIFRANNRAQGQICGNKTLWLCSKSSLFTVYTDSTIKSGISMLLDKRQNTRVHIPKHNKYWGQHTKYWESGRNNNFSFLCPLFFFFFHRTPFWDCFLHEDACNATFKYGQVNLE